MSFEGRVSRESHEGGLLISFEGKAPRLGAKLCIVGGKPLGKVETVLGPADDPLVHLFPLANGIDGSKAIDSPVEIAPRHRRDSRKPRPMGEYRGRKDRSHNSRNSVIKSGDWVCPKCKNHNFANKKVCNRTGCEEPKPRGGGRGTRDTPHNRRTTRPPHDQTPEQRRTRQGRRKKKNPTIYIFEASESLRHLFNGIL